MKTLKEFFFGKKEHPAKKHKDFTDCNFGHKEFNKVKRDKKFVEELNIQEAKGGNSGSSGKGGGKPPKNPPPPPPPPPPNTMNVVLLSFEGHTVSNTSWNYAGDIVCAYSGLAESEKAIIVANTQEDYAAFNVIITTDEAVYNAAPIGTRMRVIITETWEWYGQSGGVAFVGSFNWGDNTPCFVFSSLLGYNTKYIKEAVSHEIGHTLGLYHQSRYDEFCTKISDYHSGCCGEAPIMGVAYYQADGHWWVGPNSYGCNSIQDDAAVLQTKLGLK